MQDHALPCTFIVAHGGARFNTLFAVSRVSLSTETDGILPCLLASYPAPCPRKLIDSSQAQRDTMSKHAIRSRRHNVKRVPTISWPRSSRPGRQQEACPWLPPSETMP